MTLPPFALAQDDDDDVYLTTTSEVTFFGGLSLYVKMAILYDAGAHHLYRLWSNSNFSNPSKAAGQSNNCLNNNGKHAYLLLLLLLQSQLVLELNHSKCLSLQLQVPRLSNKTSVQLLRFSLAKIKRVVFFHQGICF